MAADTNDIARRTTPEDRVGSRFPGRSLALARAAEGLTLDDVALRTCIRPGILRRIEVDDFGACGGDFYARGHLRILGQALHVDVDGLLGAFDREHPDLVETPDGARLDEPRRTHASRTVGFAAAAIILLCVLLIAALSL